MDPATEGQSRFTALVIWSGEDSEIRSRVDALTVALREVGGSVEAASLPALMGALSVARSVASWASDELEAQVVARVAGPAIEADLRRTRPEIALALDPLAGAVAAAWRAKGLLPAAIVGLASSTTAVDPRWGGPEGAVDRLLVVDEAQKEEAAGRGIKAEVVAFDGPADYLVAGAEDRGALRRRYGIDEAAPALLVVTEALELGELTDILFQLSLVAEKATVLFDTGGDEQVDALLRQRAELYGIPAQLFGAVDEAPELWAACDVALGRPTPRTERRALAARLLLCAFAPEGAGQVARSEALVARGIGAVVERAAVLAVELDGLLARASSAGGREVFAAIHAGESAVAAAQRLAGQASEILAEALRRGTTSARKTAPVTDPAAADLGPAPAPARRKGPLESIGPSADAPDAPKARRVDREIERLELEEQLDRLKAEADAEADAGDTSAAGQGVPRSPSEDVEAQPEPPSAPGPAVGIDPKIKLGKGGRDRRVEDELAAIKRRLDGE